MLNLEKWDLSSVLNGKKIRVLALQGYILTKPLNSNYSFLEQYSAKHSLAKREEISICLPFQAAVMHL